MIRHLSKTRPKELRGVALLRLDFNTEDEWRMEAAVPTVKFLLKRSKAVVIMSHKGRPAGFQKALSLKKDAKKLAKLLNRKITFFPKFDFPKIQNEIKKSSRGGVFMLENLRFMPGEIKNDREFAKKLASLGDFYVNDAFAVSHRKNASVTAITPLLPSYAGLGLEREMNYLSKVMKTPQKPLVIILGGAKIKDKLDLLKYFKEKADAFLIGGAPANTLLALKGFDIGRSLTEKNAGHGIRAVLKFKNVVLPVDFRRKNSAILDIGPKTEILFANKIKSAKTVVWNGPMGMIEEKEFNRGTNAVARAIAQNTKAFSVIGGGETVMALKKFGLYKKIGFVSTGGGAMLEFLAGKKLPGIAALEK